MTGSRSVLLIGASRGLGLALAQQWHAEGWQVVATTRGSRPAGMPDEVELEHVDITRPEEVAALHERLAGRRFDLLFVNAGVASDPPTTVAETSEEEFCRVMVTNALSPMRVIEALQDLVAEDGTIAAMSSGQGSVANNTRGGHEVYRGSKAALNTFMRSYAARTAGSPRTLVLMAPGWVRTAIGGDSAPLTVDDSIPGVVGTLDSLEHSGGLHYVDYLGQTIPW